MEKINKNGFGITRWEKAADINARLKNLTSKPIHSISEDYLKNEVLPHFDTKCAKSKEITAEAKQYIPGGVQHNLAFNYPFPMCMVKAEGAYLYDIDGNKYYDFLQAGGPTILGSNNENVRKEAIKLINECGPVTGLFHEAELLIAKEINKHMPWVEKFRMLGSGTEAVMGSLRIARIATKKKKIIKMGGAYHGWSDQMVYDLKIGGTRNLTESHGIPSHIFRHTQAVRNNDIQALKGIMATKKLCGGNAAVILAPFGPQSGTRQVDLEFAKQVRELCDKYGALLIFDEVVTGFRVGLGGAQGFFGVQPDHTIVGKVVAGG